VKTFALAFFTACIVPLLLPAQLQQASKGSIRHFQNFPSQYVNARPIDVWLPQNYTPKNQYAVLYMQDGQMLYDSNTTWNHQEWGIDETLSQLLEEDKIIPCIVVGIWNSGAGRHADYLPQKPMESLPQPIQDSLYRANRSGGASVFNNQKVQSDNYLKFVVTELKPFIDSHFSTRPQAEYTCIAGSSMGGLLSLYAFCEYPLVFSKAACISTHWPGIFNVPNPLPEAFMQYLQQQLPPPRQRKLYFDFGTATLDSLYEPFQKKADAILQAKGYTSKNWITLKFEGASHTETAWASRFAAIAQFLLGR
jgi:predicted alpha/beta superfamily hydrolase